tara:strand:+ start:455 stop:712 length:258 start_codon:yes stop_codon:yes gene_type:complete
MNRYERVVFLQESDAEHALDILCKIGESEALLYLQQWHFPGEHMTDDNPGSGSADDTFESDGYIMSYNLALGYIGLVYDTEYQQS